LINRAPVTINISHCNIISNAVIYTLVKAPVHYRTRAINNNKIT
jgi:hypothetical protein